MSVDEGATAVVFESFATPVSPSKIPNTRQQASRARAAGLDTVETMGALTFLSK